MRVTTEQCDEIIDVVKRIRGDLATLYELDRRLAGVEVFDGFRSSVRPMEGSAGTVLDDDGFPMPPLSDPTGDGVVTVLDGTRRRSSVREDVALLSACMAEVRGIVRQADGARGRAMAPDDGGDRRKLDPDACENHERHEQGFMPVHRSSRCRRCYDFWLAEGVDMPLPLLVAYGKGQRFTERMVADALRHQPKAKSKRRKRKAG